MPLIFEDESKKLGKKQVIVPDKLVNKIKSNLNVFGQYKGTKGFKRANSIVDDDYNKRSNKKDKIHNGAKTISFSDLKRINHDLKHNNQNPNDLENILLGASDKFGDKSINMRTWAKDTLRKLRTSVKQVDAVPPVPKLEKEPSKPEDVQKDIKMGNATIRLTENQLLLLKEYHGQQVFNFDDNGEPYYKKNNYENYIDYLESIGHYGQLPPSEWNEHTISQTIDRELENIDPGRDDLNEDDYNYAFYDLITNSFFCYNNSDEIFNENFIEIMDRYEKFLEQYNYINSSGNLEYFLRSKEKLYINDEEDASIYLTDLGEEEYEKELKDAYRSHIDEYDLKNGLTINERGLIYMEREIVIPKANSPYMKSNYKGSFDNDYYKSLTDNYYGIGNCFTWQKGASEAYCANSFGIGNTYVTLKCWIDPKDVNWEETVQRNCYGLREEQEIYVNDGGAKIEVFDVIVQRVNFGDKTVSNAHILRKPIIVNP